MAKFLATCQARSLSVGLLLVVGALTAMLGCNSGGPKGDPTGRLNVVSTIGMIRDAVSEVGGEHVKSIGLMGPGIDPHLYRATAGDIRKLEEADLIFYGGLELEGKMTDIFEKMATRGTPTFAVSAGIPESQLREPPEFKGRHDPHIWFDVTLWKHAVESIRDGLSKAKPSAKADFDSNAERYLKELDALHEHVKTEIQKIPKEGRVLITAHDAFGYFGRQYGMEVIGIQGTSTAAEAGGGAIRKIADTIANRKIKAIFVESSVPRATVEALQKAVQSRGWDVKIGGQLFSDAMGKDGTPEGTYIGMVRHNVDTIVKALR